MWKCQKKDYLDPYIACALLMGLYFFTQFMSLCLIDGDLALDNLVCVTWGWLAIVTCTKAVKTNCLFWFKSKLSKQIKQCQGCQRELNENTQKNAVSEVLKGWKGEFEHLSKEMGFRIWSARHSSPPPFLQFGPSWWAFIWKWSQKCRSSRLCPRHSWCLNITQNQGWF